MCTFLIRFMSFIALVSMTLNTQCFADIKDQVGTRSKGVHKSKAPPVKSRSTDGNETHLVSKAPDMPGITLPSGKFLYGFENPSKNGRTMGARFAVPDSPSAIISFYRDALKNGGWTLNEQACTDKSVFAWNQRYGSSVTVTAFKSSAGCEVYFTYGIK